MPSATVVKRLVLDEHDTTEFCRPDPLSRPASSVAGERARPLPLFRVVDLLLRGHPHALASTNGRALEQMTGTPRSLRGPVGRRRARSPRVQEWHKCSLHTRRNPVTLAGAASSRRVPVGLPVGGRQVPECKNGTSAARGRNRLSPAGSPAPAGKRPVVGFQASECKSGTSARRVECKRGSSDGITSSQQHADASRAPCRQTAEYRRLEVFCCGLAQPPPGEGIPIV